MDWDGLLNAFLKLPPIVQIAIGLPAAALCLIVYLRTFHSAIARGPAQVPAAPATTAAVGDPGFLAFTMFSATQSEMLARLTLLHESQGRLEKLLATAIEEGETREKLNRDILKAVRAGRRATSRILREMKVDEEGEDESGG